MLLDYISRYYKFLWLALIAVSLLKIVLSYFFDENLRGMSGTIYALFKWYGNQELESEDFEPRRTVMRFHNVVTLTMYFIVFLLAIAIGLRKILAH